MSTEVRNLPLIATSAYELMLPIGTAAPGRRDGHECQLELRKLGGAGGVDGDVGDVEYGVVRGGDADNGDGACVLTVLS